MSIALMQDERTPDRAHMRPRTLGQSLRGQAVALARTIYKRGEAVIIQRDLIDGPPLQDVGRVSVVPIGQDDISSLDTLGAHGNAVSARRRMRNYIELGYRGFLAVTDETPVGYGWWVDHTFRSDHLHPAVQQYRIVLAPGDLYVFEVYVAPQHRGRGVATAFMQAAMHGWAAAGYRRAVGFVEAGNLAARTLYRMTGWTDVRRCATRTYFKRLLHVNGQWFLRNRADARPHSFDFRLIYSPSAATAG